MGKSHKLANARIEIETALPIDRAIDVARQVVATQHSLKITGEGDGVLRVQLSAGLISAPVMTFLVSATASGGRTRVVSKIDEYRTSQTTVYFIPVTAKSMEGMGVYRRFMVSFGQAMQAADPTAQIQMIERDVPGGIAPAPQVGYAQASAIPAVPLPGSAISDAVPAALVPDPAPASPAAEAPVGASPAVPAAVGNVPQAVPAPGAGVPLLSESNARIVQIVGGVIVVAGFIFWYATPSDVTVGPLIVILLGAVVAGVGFIIGRNASRAAADELAAKLRNERALAGVAPEVPLPQTAPAVPLPPSIPAVPLPQGAPAVPLPPSVPAVPLPQPMAADVPLPPAASAPFPEAEPMTSAMSASAGPIQSIPGMETSAPAAPSAHVAPVASVVEPAALDDDLDSTRITPSHTQIEWQMALGDGRRLAVGSALRVGRDPIADPAFPGTVLVPIVDPAKSLSKTHAQLEASPGVVVVTDLHSTNGTKVRTADGAEITLAPGVGHRVTGDAEISFGDYVVRLKRQVGA